MMFFDIKLSAVQASVEVVIIESLSVNFEYVV